jgi:hypothetical protein
VIKILKNKVVCAQFGALMNPKSIIVSRYLNPNHKYHQLAFTKGGDQVNQSIPEVPVCQEF